MAQDRINEIEKYAKSQAQEYYESLLKDNVDVYYARLYAGITFNNLKKGAEWADKTMLDKACEWIRFFMEYSNLFEYQNSEETIQETIKDFRNAMKE